MYDTDQTVKRDSKGRFIKRSKPTNRFDKNPDKDKTVLDEILYVKFRSAMAGNSDDADFLLSQAFGDAPRFKDVDEEQEKIYRKY